MKPLAKNAVAMPRSRIREIMHLAMDMPDAIHLEVGEPDFPTPEHKFLLSLIPLFHCLGNYKFCHS